jgi:ABC-2 type transport system ATP-binding protein
VLDDLTLTVEANDVFGFLGPNGAGKTTTLKLLMGMLRPTSGTARILGEPIESIPMRRRIGYLPEQAYFYDYLTARELVVYFGRLSGISTDDAPARADAVLERVGLPRQAWDRQLRKFSKGMLQRVGLAQAIVHDPEVVFLDEPMSGLDPIGRRHVRDLILELRDAGKTVFFSSHILSDVEALCDRVAILNGGRLVETGRLADLRAQWSGELEIVATGAPAEAAWRLSAAGYEVRQPPGGLHVRIGSERELDEALAHIREVGGKVVSVSPTRGSLEELFLREVGTEAADEPA